MLSHGLLSNGGNHAEDREENDFYATEPEAADLLNKAEWSINRLGMIWECACGQGHLSKRFDQLGYHVFSSDELFKQYPVSRIHVCRKRIKCAKNGDFTKVQSSPTCYAWFVWEKGYTGPTIIDRV